MNRWVIPMFVAVLFTPDVLAGPAFSQTIYQTLDFGTTGTFLTGIRGDNIVGNYVVSGGTGGLLYSLSTGAWTAFPVATASGTNYPGSNGSSPYGPSFGSQYGILRAVGSYKPGSSPYDTSYLYDAAAKRNAQLTTLSYPGTTGAPTLNTIAHSTFGDQVVGNYDTGLTTGNAFIYSISNGAYVTNNHPGSVSTTAYGVWGDKIAGGFSQFGPNGGPGFEVGYIYNQTTGVWASYRHPGAVFTHFEGITGAGRAGEYNLVADWSGADGQIKSAVLHLAADGTQTWIDYAVPGAQATSANSIYEDKVVGISVATAGAAPDGYIATIPGIYDPIRNLRPLVAGAPNAVAIAGVAGDDVVNTGAIVATGAGSVGVHGDTYGVITNNGSISAVGRGGAGVELNGLYGTLLNGGRISAGPGAVAIRTGPTAFGTVVVNDGIIDGPVTIVGGPQARFENSGWMGISSPGAGTTHVVSGTFVQTSAGALSLRIGPGVSDSVAVGGLAQLAGAEISVFQPGGFTKSTTLLTAGGGATGRFDTVATVGLPSFVTASLAYTPSTVTLDLASNIARSPGLSPNQVSVGAALDAAFNGSNSDAGSQPTVLEAVYGTSNTQLPAALSGLSGEAYANEQTVLIDQSLFTREAVLGRLRQISYAGQGGAEGALGANALSVVAVVDAAGPAGAQPSTSPSVRGLTFWSQAFGGWGGVNATANAAAVSESFAGLVIGADASVAGNWRVGVALGYSNAGAHTDALSSSANADTGLLAAYAGSAFGRLAVRAGGSYGFSDIKTQRSVALPGLAENPSANTTAGTGQAFGEAAYGVAWGTVGLEPFAGLAWVHLNTGGFTESGAAGLTGSGTARDVGYSSLGIRAATTYPVANGMILTPRVSIAWQHAIGEVVPSASLGFSNVSGSGFTVTGAPLARDAALIDAGFDLRVSPRAKLGISYIGQLAGDARENAVTGSFALAF